MMVLLAGLGLTGCGSILAKEQALLDWKRSVFTDQPPPLTKPDKKPIRLTTEPPAGVTASPVYTEAQKLVDFCVRGREIGLPVLFNRAAKEAANEKLGREEAAKLFWPVAKTNNDFRCLCGTVEEKKVAKC
jgi:hypothetical protein